jgi:hypothetical protein
LIPLSISSLTEHEIREEGCGAMLGLHRDPAAVSLDEHENSPAKMEKGEGKRIAVGLHLIPPIL